MFERFTDRSRRVVVLAQEEARMLGHGHIGTEHLLLGLLHEQSGIASLVLRSAGITIEAARVRVAEIIGPGAKPPRGHIPFTPRAKHVLELALREALQLGERSVNPEHVLRGLIRERDGVGAQVAARLGEPLPALRQRLADAIAAPSEDNLRKHESTAERERRAERESGTDRPPEGPAAAEQ
jgi:ATP-dependent Clp protease ATP-binding subunit ClpC